MKITKIGIRNYRGIATLDAEIPPGGTMVSGANGRGKTTFLKALKAALVAQDIGEDAIRHGADKAEILLDLDDVAVRRVINASGRSTLTVTRGGMKAQAPQTFLTELLGNSSLDPLDILLAKPKERRARILEALPITVTREQLREWAPDFSGDTSGHGLEVLARVRATYYAARADANKAELAASVEATRLASVHASLAAVVPANAPTVQAAAQSLSGARATLSRLEAQAIEAAKATERGASTRARIEDLRLTADNMRRSAADLITHESVLADARKTLGCAMELVVDLEHQLDVAKIALRDAQDGVAAIEGCCARADRFIGQASGLEQQATDLRATLAAVAVEAVPESTLEAARRSVDDAIASRAVAIAAAEAETAMGFAEKAADAHKAAKAEAMRMDAIVKALSNDAPAALLASAQAIPGLGLDGDDVTLDGTKLDALCGAEQLRFCVEIARRLNAKSRILIVDGLERLDPEQREDFVRFATADGYQLLATCVDRGAPVFATIESSDGANE